jgi:hypothetical protein
MQFRPFEAGIEVNGQTVYSIVDGFGHLKATAVRMLLEEGIGEPGEGDEIRLLPDGWYSQEAWLRVFERIAARIGSTMLHSIGLAIPRNAIFPAWVHDAHSAVRSIDIAYHINHRKQGMVMYDPQTDRMLEGIGHYGYTPVDGERKIISVCENPYPCDFDRGIITSIVRRFEPMAFVEHDDTRPCRKNGHDACTYIVTW